MCKSMVNNLMSIDFITSGAHSHIWDQPGPNFIKHVITKTSEAKQKVA